MKSIEKKRKHRTTAYLPISINLVVKTALVVLGYSVWGTAFIWALAGLYLLLPILRGILSCLLVLFAIILILFILLALS